MASPQGPNSGATFADDATIGTIAWTSPGNAAASDDSRATAVLGISQVTHYLKATNFSFTIPTGATINGIKVEVERSNNIGPTGFAQDNSVKIVKGGVISGDNKALLDAWGSVDVYKTYGGPTDLWGLAWTAADINASTFGVAFAVGEGGDGGITVRVDHIRITVYFTWAGPASGATFADDASVGTIAWVLPGNAAASDNADATALVLAAAETHYLKATNFNFAIPAVASIKGIKVEIEKSEGGAINGDFIQDNSVRLVKGGVISGDDKAIPGQWPSIDAYIPYGGSTDLWGLTWTPADIEASTFGVVISAEEGSGTASKTASIDHIRITVYYSVGGITKRTTRTMMTGFGS